MEGPLLSKSEHITIKGDASSNAEHFVNIAADDECLSTLAQVPYLLAFGLNAFEFVMTLVQIVAATIIVRRAKESEHLEAAWIIAYICGCIATLAILCWRVWNNRNAMLEIRINSALLTLSTVLEYFFVGWSIVFLWVFVDNSASLDHTTPLFWLCVVFLAFSFIRYVLPKLVCAAMCCCMSVTLCISGVWAFFSLNSE